MPHPTCSIPFQCLHLHLHLQVTEDEVYELQFGESFASQALNPLAGSIDRDDFALGIANMDE